MIYAERTFVKGKPIRRTNYIYTGLFLMYNKHMDTTQRFFSKVNMGDGLNDCWLWVAWSNGKGYGLIKIKGRSMLAHRYSYELHKGTIEAGKVIDHLCRQPSCVNPDHLEAVTQKVNTERAIGAVWESRRKQTHCLHGHELYGDNLYVRKDGKRACKICKNKSARNARSKQQLASAH